MTECLGSLRKLYAKKRGFTSQESLDVFRHQGTVRIASQDWNVLNFKDLLDHILKRPLPIKIQENKRFIITRGKTLNVRGEPTYRNDIMEVHVITKKGHSFRRNPSFVPSGLAVNEAKKNDISKLLNEHAGEGWETDPRFSFLASVVAGTDHAHRGSCSAEHDAETCDCLGEDPISDKISDKV